MRSRDAILCDQASHHASNSGCILHPVFDANTGTLCRDARGGNYPGVIWNPNNFQPVGSTVSFDSATTWAIAGRITSPGLGVAGNRWGDNSDPANLYGQNVRSPIGEDNKSTLILLKFGMELAPASNNGNLINCYNSAGSNGWGLVCKPTTGNLQLNILSSAIGAASVYSTNEVANLGSAGAPVDNIYVGAIYYGYSSTATDGSIQQVVNNTVTQQSVPALNLHRNTPKNDLFTDQIGISIGGKYWSFGGVASDMQDYISYVSAGVYQVDGEVKNISQIYAQFAANPSIPLSQSMIVTR